jgi:hypothetical protein
MKMRKSAIALLATVMMASFVHAEDAAAPAAPMGQGQMGKGPKANNMTFEEMKTKMSTNLEKRLAKLNAIKECVNAATTKEQLEVCAPKKKPKQNKPE